MRVLPALAVAFLIVMIPYPSAIGGAAASPAEGKPTIDPLGLLDGKAPAMAASKEQARAEAQTLKGALPAGFAPRLASPAFLEDLAARMAAPTGPAVPELGASDGIGPGSALLMGPTPTGFPTSLCTASYLFQSGGKAYLATAGHCIVQDETDGTPRSGRVDAAPVMNRIMICVADCLNNALELGTYVNLVPETGYHPVAFARSGGIGLDAGFIEIPARYNDILRPWLPQFGGPDGLAEGALGDLMVHFGHGNYCCHVVALATRTPFDQGRLAMEVDNDGESIWFAGQVTGGDSGSALGLAELHEDRIVQGGDAVGIITHLGMFATDLRHAVSMAQGYFATNSGKGLPTAPLALITQDGELEDAGEDPVETGPVVTIVAPAEGATLAPGGFTVTGTVDRAAPATGHSGLGGASTAPLPWDGIQPAGPLARLVVGEASVGLAVPAAPGASGPAPLPSLGKGLPALPFPSLPGIQVPLPVAPADGPFGLPGSAVVPGVAGDIGPVTVSDADGLLTVTMALNGELDAAFPGPFGMPMTYDVQFATSHNGLELTYRLGYAYVLDPEDDAVVVDAFDLTVLSAASNGLQSYCAVPADLSLSHYDAEAFAAVWVLPLSAFKASNLAPQGGCANQLFEGRGLQGGDVLASIVGGATAQAAFISLGDLRATTDPFDYTVVGDGDVEPAVEKVVLLLNDEEVGHAVVSTSAGTAQAEWAIETVFTAGAHILEARWIDIDGASLAIAQRQITVGAGGGGACVDGSNTCFDNGNSAPVVESAAIDAAPLANDVVGLVSVAGVVRDNNGFGTAGGKLDLSSDESVRVASIKRGGVSVCLGEGAGCIGVDSAELVEGSAEAGSNGPTTASYSIQLHLPVGLPEGIYSVNVTATDSAGAMSWTAATVTVYAPGDFVLDIPGGAVTFPGGGVPGQTVTSTHFTVHNTHKDEDAEFAAADLGFEMAPFEKADGESFDTVDRLVLLVDKSGEANFEESNPDLVAVPYGAILTGVGEMPADATWAIKLQLAVPLGIGSGSYGSSFSVFAT